MPVKASTGDHKNMLFMKALHSKILIGFKIIQVPINAVISMEETSLTPLPKKNIIGGDPLQPTVQLVSQNGFSGGGHSHDIAVGHRFAQPGGYRTADTVRQGIARLAG